MIDQLDKLQPQQNSILESIMNFIDINFSYDVFNKAKNLSGVNFLSRFIKQLQEIVIKIELKICDGCLNQNGVNTLEVYHDYIHDLILEKEFLTHRLEIWI